MFDMNSINFFTDLLYQKISHNLKKNSPSKTLGLEEKRKSEYLWSYYLIVISLLDLFVFLFLDNKSHVNPESFKWSLPGLLAKNRII